MRASRLEEHLARWGGIAPRSLSVAGTATMGLEELLALADPEAKRLWSDLTLGYASTSGLPLLREAIAKAFESAGADDVLACAGAQEGLFLAMRTLLGPGDHVVSFVPCYEDLASLPEAFGAEVTRVPLRPERDWRVDLAEVSAAFKPTTRLLVLNFPSNPTGATVTRDELDDLVGLAAARGVHVLSDEVFRLLSHEPAEIPPPVADLYERGISLDVTGKALGLGGVRVGWLVSRDRSFLDEATAVKTHLSICNGAPDEVLALIALRAADRIVAGNLDVIRTNLDVLDSFFARQAERIRWTRPRAGCLGYPELLAGDVEDLAEAMAREEGTILFPARLFLDDSNRFRLGFGRPDLPELIPALERRLSSLPFSPGVRDCSRNSLGRSGS